MFDVGYLILMSGADYIDDFIRHEKRTVLWYWGWLALILVIGAILIIINFTMGWIKEIGPNIGVAFVLFFTKFPLAEVLKRRDRIAALANIKTRYSQVRVGSSEAKRVESLLSEMLTKMLGG